MLLGRRRRAVTTFVYDEETGRLARAVTVWDPEWTDADRAWAQAHAEEQAALCPGCGLPLDETTHPDSEGEYESPLPTRCFACTSLEVRKAEYKEKPEALLFAVHRRKPD